MDTDELRRERGRRLAAVRRRITMTAEEMVRRLKVVTKGRLDFTSGAVYAWEKGRNLLQENVAMQLAPILGCSANELLGPLSSSELDFPLGGGAAISDAPEEALAAQAREELDVELTLRSRIDGSLVRKRSWQIDIDVEKCEIVIRPGEGCTSESLKFFRPTETGCEELKGRPDYRNLGALRIPFDPNVVPTDEDTPVLFMQQVLEAVPLFKDDLPTRSEVRQPVRKSIARRRLSKDIQFELADFLDDDTAQRLTALWEESSEAGEHLEHYCERILPRERDPFQQRLQEALIHTCLLKDHEQGRVAIDFLEALAGDDPRRIADAAYLSGRNRWYLGADRNDRSELPKAIDDLTRAIQYARRVQNAVRMGQAYVYLSRIGIEQADRSQEIKDKTGHDVIQLAEMAKEIGIKHQRPDIELLAERLHVIRLHNEKEYDECIDRGKRLLERIRSTTATGFDLNNIESNLAIHVGLALRRRNREGDQQEAEQIYLDAISCVRNDSTAGMSMYLLGDIYADRMLKAISEAATAKSESQRDEEIEASKQHRIKAQDWYDQAMQALKSRGDRKALAKAAFRSLWIRSGEFPEPRTRQHVATSHVARELHINQKLIGDGFAKQVRSVPMELFEEILKVVHLRIDEASEEIQPIRSTDYVDAETLVAVPRNLGTALMVQLLALDASAPRTLQVKGWVTIPSYSSQIRPLLKQFQQQASRPAWSEAEWKMFQEQLTTAWFAILDRIEVIEPLRLPVIKRLVVVTPDDHLDAMLPIEALIDNEATKSRLLTSISDAVLYAGPWGAPLQTAAVAIRRDDIHVYADHTETKNAGSSRGRGQSLLKIVAAETGFEADRLPEFGATLNNTAVVIVAHADSEGKLRERIRSWKFAGVRAVFLLFCGSGTLDLISGPFSDGVAQRVRRQLDLNGIVCANRLPVSAGEAMKLLKTLRDDASDDRPVARIVTGYMSKRLREQQNPFDFPWFVI